MSGKWVEVTVSEYDHAYGRSKRRVSQEFNEYGKPLTTYEKWVEDKPEPTADLIWWNNKVWLRDGDRYWYGDGNFVLPGHLAKYGSYTELVAVPKKEWGELVGSLKKWSGGWEHQVAKAGSKLVEAQEKLT